MAARHRVVALLAGEVVAFDLAIPAQIFGREPDLYEWAVCAPEPGPVATENGFGSTMSPPGAVLPIGYCAESLGTSCRPAAALASSALIA